MTMQKVTKEFIEARKVEHDVHNHRANRQVPFHSGKTVRSSPTMYSEGGVEKWAEQMFTWWQQTD